MKSAFKAFMTELIDYAGLFPPANLSMDDAIQNYLDYISGEDEWILSRFICPASRLKDLDKYRDNFRLLKKPLHISFLSRAGKNSEDFINGLNDDLQIVKEFKNAHGDKVSLDVFEAQFPDSLIEESNPVRVTEFLNQVAEVVESQKLVKLKPFYEGAFWGEWSKTIDALVEGISYHNVYVQSKPDHAYQSAGYKLRCGGADPSVYPSPEQAAKVIQTCKHHQVSLKATAGLHHPLRHFNKDEQVQMHGFINIFGAGIIAQYHDLKLNQIRSIVEDEEAKNFIFTDSHFKWNEFSVTTDQIQKARQRNIISFGSCSFDEPLEDLQQLGLL